MDDSKKRLTLDQPANYEIRVPGEIEARWSEWADRIAVSIECREEDAPVTILTGCLDQAGLHGLLRQIYSLGLPLISVIWMEASSQDPS